MVEEINIMKKWATCPGLIKSNESLSPDLAEEGAQHGHCVQVTSSAWDSDVVHEVFTVDWHNPLCSQKTEAKQKLDQCSAWAWCLHRDKLSILLFNWAQMSFK